LVFLGFPLHRPGDPSNARADHLKDVDVPMLFVQGTRDRLAEMERMEAVVGNLGGRAELRVVQDADHGFDVLKRTGKSTEQVYLDIAAVVRGWTDRILP
ncbi:MAG: alpha/beta family hydrolase, partial [Gemmatimonadota bacterium]